MVSQRKELVMVSRCVLPERNIVMGAQLLLHSTEFALGTALYKCTELINLKNVQFELSIYKTPVCEKDRLHQFHPSQDAVIFQEISNYGKISIKREIVSRNAFLLHKMFCSTVDCHQIHNVYPFFPMSYISCFNHFQNFIALWYKDLNNYTDLHKTITIKLNGFSW